jgi:hypothetical protein
MVSSLGLSQIGAVGLSSYEKNNRFINKSFVSVEGKRKGLLTIAGDKPHKFELPEFAPNGVSIAFEEDINLKTFFEMMIEIIKDIPGSEEFDELMTKLNEPIAPGLFSTMDIIEKADTKIMMAVKMDKEKMVTIPDEDFRFPYTDAVISIDNMGFIVPKLIEMVKDSGLFSIKEFDKYQSIHLVQEFPGDMSSYSPIMQRDKETNRLYIATTPAFLSKCLGTDNKLSGDKSYQVAVADLPVNEGNALSYISPEFSGFVSSILKEALHNEKKLKFIAGLIDEQLKDSNIPQASVLKVEENGIYSVSSSAYSHKLTFLALGYFNPVTLGIIAAASISSIF